jgi:hypothetical protein
MVGFIECLQDFEGERWCEIEWVKRHKCSIFQILNSFRILNENDSARLNNAKKLQKYLKHCPIFQILNGFRILKDNDCFTLNDRQSAM